MKIRKATLEDIPRLIKLDEIWFKEKITAGLIIGKRKDFTKSIKNGICFVAVENGKVIGYVNGIKGRAKIKHKCFGFKNGEQFIEVDRLFVLKNYRKKKVGNELMKVFLDNCKAKGCKRIMVIAGSIKLNELVSFYKKFGFKAAITGMSLRVR